MSLPRITSFEVKTSRTDQPVAVVNGVHLHSIYNPDKEAEALVATHLEQLKNKNEVLVLGLGFGYHLNSLSTALSELHGDNYKIVVIEPNTQVYDQCVEHKLLNNKNVTVYSGYEPRELYSDLELIHFLLSKPAIIAHPPSFNLYQLYFKTILTFSAPQDLTSVVTYVGEPEIKQYLSRFDNQLTFEEALYGVVARKNELTETDFLAMALVEMTAKSIARNNGDKEL